MWIRNDTDEGSNYGKRRNSANWTAGVESRVLAEGEDNYFYTKTRILK